MIVTVLKGGLGNQMFCYAAARRLAHKRGTKLFMDLSWFELADQVDTKRVYELDCFNLEQKFIKRSDFVIANSDSSLKIKAYRLTKGLLKPRLNPYIEKTHEFDKQVLNLPDNTFLEGFWQNENYFKDIRKILLSDFYLNNSPTDKNNEALKQISDTTAISLHIRRGDYAANKETNAFHGLMGVDYYKKAVEIIAKKVNDPHFFVFSDEPAWCKKNLKLSFPATYISGNKAGYEDLRLMISCRHHITANSSFSWWGAWLDPRTDKIVISPKRWFSDPAMVKAEIVPDQWIKI